MPFALHHQPVAAARRRISILGVAIDDLLEGEVIAQADALIAEGGPHHLVTINPEFV
ncbi:MAG: glycosyltransferase, partial [Oscillochloris sp.]|nr:glycosyltransferase [Oscillochloris sp.]